MADSTLHVELVAVERMIWSGEATMVLARTTEGELGILPGHIPLLGQLADGGVVRIDEEGGEQLMVAVHGGFLSVTEQGVSILAELAEFADEIDVSRARRALDNSSLTSDDEPERQAALRAMSRLKAAGEAV
ncbi:MAG: F0F1 ATP synthase subunit epsilon [Geodermatophilaceae bacterium]|nr:F0F1 ATP synthase subunit epsilon [Geodermatophilaceae bacterium]MDQ3456282.1 F0F1 ATP synthase subunit epsilon [Actinomycetota bacterium]